MRLLEEPCDTILMFEGSEYGGKKRATIHKTIFGFNVVIIVIDSLHEWLIL